MSLDPFNDDLARNSMGRTLDSPMNLMETKIFQTANPNLQFFHPMASVPKNLENLATNLATMYQAASSASLKNVKGLQQGSNQESPSTQEIVSNDLLEQLKLWTQTPRNNIQATMSACTLTSSPALSPTLIEGTCPQPSPRYPLTSPKVAFSEIPSPRQTFSDFGSPDYFQISRPGSVESFKGFSTFDISRAKSSPELHHETKSDLDPKERRRQINRKASKKRREKQKAQEVQFAATLEDLKEENQRLRLILSSLGVTGLL